jgi:nucleosome binding factor SPN SPT16 subunit
MSSTETASVASSFVSEGEYLSEYEEVEADESDEFAPCEETGSEVNADVSSDEEAYAWIDDPVADEEWTENYEQEMREKEILKARMLTRLDGTTPTDEWYVR